MTKRIYDSNVVKARLKELRREKGVTQAEVAKAVHFSVSTIKQYENGYRIPDSLNLATLAEYYSVQENYILGLSEHRTKLSELFATFSREEIAESRMEMAICDAITLIGNHLFGIDPEDHNALHALDIYIRLYPEFVDEYNQWKRKEDGNETRYDKD